MPALFEEHDALLGDVDALFLSSLRGRINSEQVVSSQEMSHDFVGSTVDLDEDAAGHPGKCPPHEDTGPLLLINHGSTKYVKPQMLAKTAQLVPPTVPASVATLSPCGDWRGVR